MAKKRGKSRSKFAFDFEEFSELIGKIDEAGGNITEAVESSLKATHAYMTPNLQSAIGPHRLTGVTEGSLQTSGDVVWDTPLSAHIRIGFAIRAGGMASIFLMWGTPKMKPDAKLKAAAVGAKTKRDVAEIQRRELERALQEALRG